MPRIHDTWFVRGSYAAIASHEKISLWHGEWGCVLATDLLLMISAYARASARAMIDYLRVSGVSEQYDYAMSHACAQEKAARDMLDMLGTGDPIQKTSDVLRGRVSKAGIPAVMITRDAIRRLNRDHDLLGYELLADDDVPCPAYKVVPHAGSSDEIYRLFTNANREVMLLFTGVHSLFSQAMRAESLGDDASGNAVPTVHSPCAQFDEHGRMMANADDMISLFYVAAGIGVEDDVDGGVSIEGDRMAVSVMIDTATGFFGRGMAEKMAWEANLEAPGACDAMRRTGGYFVSISVNRHDRKGDMDIIEPGGKIVKESER